jgi:hypothetical protein
LLLVRDERRRAFRRPVDDATESFPLDFDYVHVSRYGQATSGGALSWRASRRLAVSGRTVLVVDDILDEGLTLIRNRDRCCNWAPGLLYGGGGRQADRPGEAH